MPLDEADFSAWFRLIEAPGLGRGTARRLLSQCGSPAAVLTASPTLLRSVQGAKQAAELLQRNATVEQRLQQALQWLSGGADRHVITLDSPWYPTLLLHSPDPPLLLYLQGQPQVLAGRGIAIVGSRNATAQGLDNAKAFGKALSQLGLVVFSGLAAGIDAAAHEGALAAAAAGGSATVAVVGTGLDLVYPKAHADLARRISQAGALVSEFSPGTPPLSQNFPQRNRILAGLSLGTLVVEAAMQSGSLITARLASEAGREVFAVPGSIHAAQSKGCHLLLKQGAKLVETAQDIVEELEGALTSPRAPAAEAAPGQQDAPVDAELQSLLDALGNDPLNLETLVDRTGWPAAVLGAKLMQLELEGHVARLPGSLFQRRYVG